MDELARDFFGRHPDVTLAALGARHNAASLDLEPASCPVKYFAAEQHPSLVERYRDANALAFPGDLTLPGWVLSDLYLLPSAIGLLVCPGSFLDVPTRKRLSLGPEDVAIAAAYYAAPTIEPGTFIGVSLLSLVPKILASAWVKALTLKMVRARRLRGVAQWASPAVRVHTRMGPLRVVSSVPGTHEFRAKSFVYESNLEDSDAWSAAMARKPTTAVAEKIPSSDFERLAAMCASAEAGEQIFVVPPGLDPSGNVLIRRGAP
ncbi:MAG: hypothetical protein IPI67_26465 [Myxococcales bacterium]|nr:hypothetical protein [Myxococcales bacterium]